MSGFRLGPEAFYTRVDLSGRFGIKELGSFAKTKGKTYAGKETERGTRSGGGGG